MEDLFALEDRDVEVVLRQERSSSPAPFNDDLENYEVAEPIIITRPSATAGEPEFNFDYQPARTRAHSPTTEPFNLGLDEEVVVKQRAPQAKLDDARLLGPLGIPKIRDHVRNKIRIRGKGHELQDLSHFIENYQFWAHELFPKAKFRDTIKMIRKVGKTKLMKSHRRGIINDFLPKPAPEEVSDAEVDEDVGEEIQARDDSAADVRQQAKMADDFFDDDDQLELSDFETQPPVPVQPNARPIQGLQGISNDVPEYDLVEEMDDVDDMDALEAMGVTI